MKNLPTILSIVILCFSASFSEIKAQDVMENKSTIETFNVSVPTAGNSWVMSNNTFISTDIVTKEGIRDWRNKEHTIRTFFYIGETGKISLGINARVRAGISSLMVTFQNKSKEITLNENDFYEIYIGDFQIKKAGYYFVDISGLKKEAYVYAEINDILLGKVNEATTKYIKYDFYFGRRGPSVHLNFKIPEGVKNVEWFYSELLIPNNEDVIGSYFMANGFGEGYFGIQVNSSTERRILFSIWSPFKTDKPSEVPEEYKIKLLKKGKDVISGKFGDEGSGGQSYKVFNWKSNVKYGFLVGAKPTNDGSTDYIAYFYNPEISSWSLIAQFKRPKTSTYLTNLYSFLENFIPDQGVFTRKGLYGNQWIYNFAGWHELTKVKFTADNTARKENRLDYSGGKEKDSFYLKNCGFTNDLTPINSKFERNQLKIAPNIDFKLLE